MSNQARRLAQRGGRRKRTTEYTEETRTYSPFNRATLKPTVDYTKEPNEEGEYPPKEIKYTVRVEKF